MGTIAGIFEYGKPRKKGCKSLFDILKNGNLVSEEFASRAVSRLLLGGIDFQTYPLKN